MKKHISLLLCIALFCSIFCIPSAMAESVPMILVDNVTANPGDTIGIDISLQNNPGIVSMTLKVSYDTTVLTLTNVQDGGILGAQSHKPQYSSPYTLAWVNDTATTDFIANGVIVSLVFEVSESATVGEEYPVTVSYDADNYDIYNKDVDCVDFEVTNGSVTVDTATVEPTPTPLSDFTYRMVDGNLCITGYNGSDTEVFIAETYEVGAEKKTVVAIDESAFEGNEEIVSITIPAFVNSIGDYAFYDCIALTDVILWSKYAAIGEQAFGYYYISRKLDGKVEGFNIIGYKDSSAENYAQENNFLFSTQTKPFARGDIDANGELNSQDLIGLRNYLIAIIYLDGDYLSAADVNTDGEYDIRDLVRLKKKAFNFTEYWNS